MKERGGGSVVWKAWVRERRGELGVERKGGRVGGLKAGGREGGW